jgi:hypothetical protein
MVALEKREIRQISFFVRGLKASGPLDSSNLLFDPPQVFRPPQILSTVASSLPFLLFCWRWNFVW